MSVIKSVHVEIPTIHTITNLSSRNCENKLLGRPPTNHRHAALTW